MHPQRDGRYYIGVSPGAEDRPPAALAPLIALAPLTALADLAEAHGSTRVRISPYQKLIVLDVSPARWSRSAAAWTGSGSPPGPACPVTGAGDGAALSFAAFGC